MRDSNSNSNRTRRAQEMHAEQLLKVSTSLFTAFFVAILIVPISAIVNVAFNGINVDTSRVFLNLFSSGYTIIFILAELGLYILVAKTKSDALAIYDELYPD